jgi:nucleotide-binding universal stress UspA family protein
VIKAANSVGEFKEKILIAYDGSAAADIAIDSLCRAGLSTEDVEALVVSVAEVWLPPPARNEVLDDTFPLQIPPGLKQAREHAAAIMAEGEERAERGKKRVQHVFPGWSVSTGVVNGSPAFELLNRAEEWQPQLLVVGSHGHTAVGRLVLGSVSQKVLTEAPTSVRIGRAIIITIMVLELRTPHDTSLAGLRPLLPVLSSAGATATYQRGGPTGGPM